MRIHINRRRSITRAALLLPIIFVLAHSHSSAGQANSQSADPIRADDVLRTLLAIPGVAGHESQIAEAIRVAIPPSLHPSIDNLGDVVVTIGTGAPHRLIVTPMDEAGFVVSEITDDGYLRLQRSSQSPLPPIFNELYSAQPVKIGTAAGKWIDGVVAGLSVHLSGSRANPPSTSDIENMYVDIGASSAAEARRAGVDVLSPVALNREMQTLGNGKVAGASVGDRFGAAALINWLQIADPSKITGTMQIAFVVQQHTGERGLARVLSAMHPDEMIYVGRLEQGGLVPGMENVRRAPRREPGSGVLIGMEQTNGLPAGFATDLKKLADANGITFAADYSATLTASSDFAESALPARWVHLGIATGWHDTAAETIDARDLSQLDKLLQIYAQGSASPTSSAQSAAANAFSVVAPIATSLPNPPPNTELLKRLVVTYGASGHEQMVREMVKSLLPKWAHPTEDADGNLILTMGTAPADSKSPKILFIAHMDEIGFSVKSISQDGRLEVETLGGFDLSFYEGHLALVHTALGDRDAVIELPAGWDAPNFKWPRASENVIRVDVGARNPDEVARLGIKPGDAVTIPKAYRPLLGTRANGRSFDDRVGCTALISAVWTLGGPVKDRDVTFVWSTAEETGLNGASALAKELSDKGRVPNFVFAADTFVTSDSPLESKRFAYAELGKGFVIRARDDSNVVRPEFVDRVIKLARANQIPVQWGATGGGNDGSVFVPYGSADVALGWPLRYSHSPAEVIDTRDMDALARMVAAVATSW